MTPEELDRAIKAQLPALPAPEHLRSRVRLALKAELEHRPRRRWPRTLALAASLLIAVSATWHFVQRSSERAELAREIVASHIRSLEPERLVEIRSSDAEQLKAWLQSQVSFSPPVPNAEPGSFPLVGGRVDHLHGRTVAALVYQARAQVINVFVWPEGGNESVGERTENGYNLIYWKKGGWEFWVVSTMNRGQLRNFVEGLERS
ncbi:MAG TPA: hypothetical protein VMG41_12800 [Gemmatimonadales bacterium]|nr:hypothetical protein [Gemmatimonadales bacterium]